jgi:hypothetical protein
MKGYVENVGRVPVYVLKGIVNHGDRITFNKLLKRFGDEADTTSEKTFADWLSKNKFVDKSKWKIVTTKPKVKPKADVVENKEQVEEVESKEDVVENKEQVEEVESKEDAPISKVTVRNKEIIKQVITGVSRELTADDVAKMSVSEGSKSLPKINDVKLLKAALLKAEKMAQKATLCNKLRDRITELNVR